jgi:hypothetical protein
MLADPQTLTINTVATPVYKTNQGPTQAVYTSADGLKTFTVKQNSTAKRFRREVRITQQKVAADPISAVNSMEGVSVYFVIDEPKNGVFTNAEIAYLFTGLSDWVLASTHVDQILRGES